MWRGIIIFTSNYKKIVEWSGTSNFCLFCHDKICNAVLGSTTLKLIKSLFHSFITLSSTLRIRSNFSPRWFPANDITSQCIIRNHKNNTTKHYNNNIIGHSITLHHKTWRFMVWHFMTGLLIMRHFMTWHFDIDLDLIVTTFVQRKGPH